MNKGVLAGAKLPALPEAGRLVVGFSGGADSTALAHWLMGQVPKERIVLAHVNHLLRGEEAQRDQHFAEDFAKRHGLPLEVLREDVARLAQERGQGLEECGRAVRYGFFSRLAPEKDDRVLTAHTANDNAETVLLHLCRGAALEGLCGIPYQRGKILRPLLEVSREEIEAYCRENGLSFVTDSSNLSDSFARNRLRHQVIPLLESFNPRFIQTAGQTAALLCADRDHLAAEARELLERAGNPWGLEAAVLSSAPEALRSRALKLFLEEAGCRLERKHLALAERVLQEGGGADLPGGVSLGRSQGVFWALPTGTGEGYQMPVKIGENPLPGGKILVLREKIQTKGENSEKIQNLLFKNALDYDIMTRTLEVRTRRPGDGFAPAGRGLRKTLKQLFQELRIPAPLRNSLPLLVCGGDIAWIPGAGAGEGFQATEKTGKILTVEVKKG